MSPEGYEFHAPPGWSVPGPDWTPPAGWTPDPNWPPAPEGWTFWVLEPAAPVASQPIPPPPTSVSTLTAREPATEVRPLPRGADDDATSQALRARVAELEAEVTRLKAAITSSAG